MEAPASKTSPERSTVAMRPPTTTFRSNIRMSKTASSREVEKRRRKCATDEPPMPLPTMQTVARGSDVSACENESEKRKTRTMNIVGRMSCRGLLVLVCLGVEISFDRYLRLVYKFNIII